MKSVEDLARRHVVSLAVGVHGGEAFRYLREGRSVIDFSASMNPLGPPVEAITAIGSSLQSVSLYPDPDADLLRESVSRYLGCVGRENVFVGNGSCEVIHLFAEVFVDEGDDVLIPQPAFAEYEVAVRKMGGRPRLLPPDDRFNIDAEKVADEIRGDTKAIFICNPNNPTGRLLRKMELLKMVRRAAELEALVLLDEVFLELTEECEENTLASHIKEFPNLLIIRSFTKTFALTALRVGYGLADAKVVRLLNRIKTPWNVNHLAQEAAAAALESGRYLDRARRLIRRERSFLHRELKKIEGLEPKVSDANFLLVRVAETGLPSARIKELLLDRGILVRDCSSFKGMGEEYIRVAVKSRGENRKLLSALRSVLS